MPTIIETPGAADANSFQSLDELDAYLAAHPYGQAALARSQADRESALIVSARLLSTTLCYGGQPASPRSAVTSFPVEVRDAQAELARLILASPDTDPTAETEASAAGLTSIKAGSVALTFDKDKIKGYSPVPASVRAMIPAAWLCQAARPRQVFAVY